MTFPTLRPTEDPSTVWAVQTRLLLAAERLLGPRDYQKKVYQPQFGTDGQGPHIVNTPTFDGAFANLSANAAGYWPTLVFELAHETVHLLNPIEGHTNWIEEGVAVAFSIHAQAIYGISLNPIPPGAYWDAFTLVDALPGGTFAFAKMVRAKFGTLHSFNGAELSAEFPRLSAELASRLADSCVPWTVKPPPNSGPPSSP
jgi:hypothetical protein